MNCGKRSQTTANPLAVGPFRFRPTTKSDQSDQSDQKAAQKRRRPIVFQIRTCNPDLPMAQDGKHPVTNPPETFPFGLDLGWPVCNVCEGEQLKETLVSLILLAVARVLRNRPRPRCRKNRKGDQFWMTKKCHLPSELFLGPACTKSTKRPVPHAARLFLTRYSPRPNLVLEFGLLRILSARFILPGATTHHLSPPFSSIPTFFLSGSFFARFSRFRLSPPSLQLPSHGLRGPSISVPLV